MLSTKQLNSISKSRETILQELEEGAGVTHVFSENNCVLHGKHKAINKAHKLLLKVGPHDVSHVLYENNCVLHGKHKAINKAHKILLKVGPHDVSHVFYENNCVLHGKQGN